MNLSQQNKTDLLEIAIILAMFFLIIVIYVPVAIWEEEEHFKKESRYRMNNLYGPKKSGIELCSQFLITIDDKIGCGNIINSLLFASTLQVINVKEFFNTEKVITTDAVSILKNNSKDFFFNLVID